MSVSFTAEYHIISNLMFFLRELNVIQDWSCGKEKLIGVKIRDYFYGEECEDWS